MPGTAGMLALRNAVANASRDPITDAEIADIPRGDCGRAAHVYAIFSDASLATLAAAGRANGIDLPLILRAYGKARAAGATNRQLDAALTELIS